MTSLSSSWSLSLTLGARVLVGGLKSGQLRYLGRVHFAEGEWCGVELDEADGLHDGAVGGVRYFACARMRGIFAPRFRVTSSQQLSQQQQPQQLKRQDSFTPGGGSSCRGRKERRGRSSGLSRNNNNSNSLEDLTTSRDENIDSSNKVSFYRDIAA